MLHDDGFIIEGHHPYVPEGYVMQHSDNCEACDWYNMGVIRPNTFDSTTFDSTTFDSTTFDSTTFDSTTFDSTTFDSTTFDSTTFEIIEPVTFDYNRYGGGYIFWLYQQTLTDVNGCPVDNDDLDAWIREMAPEEYF